MVSLGVQMAFFFIRLRRRAISHSVRRIQGAWTVPGLASGGGGVSRERALLVEIPATALWTLVPMAPGGRGGRGGLGVLGTFILGGLGGLGSLT